MESMKDRVISALQLSAGAHLVPAGLSQGVPLGRHLWAAGGSLSPGTPYCCPLQTQYSVPLKYLIKLKHFDRVGQTFWSITFVYGFCKCEILNFSFQQLNMKINTRDTIKAKPAYFNCFSYSIRFFSDEVSTENQKAKWYPFNH